METKLSCGKMDYLVKNESMFLFDAILVKFRFVIILSIYMGMVSCAYGGEKERMFLKGCEDGRVGNGTAVLNIGRKGQKVHGQSVGCAKGGVFRN